MQVGMVASFQVAPKKIHMQAVHQILEYLKDTLDFGLWYLSDKDFSVTTYIDADWAYSI